MEGDNVIGKPDDAYQIYYKEKNPQQNNSPAVFFKINPVIQKKTQTDQRNRKKEGVVGKSAGKVQMQGGEPRSCHTTARAGDSSEIFDGASGKPGDQIVSNPDDKQNFYF